MQLNNTNTLHSEELGNFIEEIMYFTYRGIQTERLERLSNNITMINSFFTENIIAKLDQDGRNNLLKEFQLIFSEFKTMKKQNKSKVFIENNSLLVKNLESFEALYDFVAKYDEDISAQRVYIENIENIFRTPNIFDMFRTSNSIIANNISMIEEELGKIRHNVCKRDAILAITQNLSPANAEKYTTLFQTLISKSEEMDDNVLKLQTINAISTVLDAQQNPDLTIQVTKIQKEAQQKIRGNLVKKRKEAPKIIKDLEKGFYPEYFLKSKLLNNNLLIGLHKEIDKDLIYDFVQIMRSAKDLPEQNRQDLFLYGKKGLCNILQMVGNMTNDQDKIQDIKLLLSVKEIGKDSEVYSVLLDVIRKMQNYELKTVAIKEVISKLEITGDNLTNAIEILNAKDRSGISDKYDQIQNQILEKKIQEKNQILETSNTLEAGQQISILKKIEISEFTPEQKNKIIESVINLSKDSKNYGDIKEICSNLTNQERKFIPIDTIKDIVQGIKGDMEKAEFIAAIPKSFTSLKPEEVKKVIEMVESITDKDARKLAFQPIYNSRPYIPQDQLDALFTKEEIENFKKERYSGENSITKWDNYLKYQAEKTQTINTIQANNTNTQHSQKLEGLIESIPIVGQLSVEKLESLSNTITMINSFFTENMIAKLDQDKKYNLELTMHIIKYNMLWDIEVFYQDNANIQLLKNNVESLDDLYKFINQYEKDISAQHVYVENIKNKVRTPSNDRINIQYLSNDFGKIHNDGCIRDAILAITQNLSEANSGIYTTSFYQMLIYRTSKIKDDVLKLQTINEINRVIKEEEPGVKQKIGLKKQVIDIQEQARSKIIEDLRHVSYPEYLLESKSKLLNNKLLIGVDKEIDKHLMLNFINIMRSAKDLPQENRRYLSLYGKNSLCNILQMVRNMTNDQDKIQDIKLLLGAQEMPYLIVKDDEVYNALLDVIRNMQNDASKKVAIKAVISKLQPHKNHLIHAIEILNVQDRIEFLVQYHEINYEDQIKILNDIQINELTQQQKNNIIESVTNLSKNPKNYGNIQTICSNLTNQDREFIPMDKIIEIVSNINGDMKKAKFIAAIPESFTSLKPEEVKKVIEMVESITDKDARKLAFQPIYNSRPYIPQDQLDTLFTKEEIENFKKERQKYFTELPVRAIEKYDKQQAEKKRKDQAENTRGGRT
jgi:hypothetical protein